MTLSLKDVVKVPIATTQTGRYPRPRWFNYDIGDRGWVEVNNDLSFREAYVDAVRTVMADHELAGLDLLTDGCVRYDPPSGGPAAWGSNGIAYVGGLKKVEQVPQDSKVLVSSIVGEDNASAFYKLSALPRRTGVYRWVVEDEPSVGKLGIWLETAKVALSVPRKLPFKFSGPSAGHPPWYYVINKTGKSDRDIFFQLFKVQNSILREIANAGCKIIQLDYPFGFAHWAAQLNKKAITKEMWKDLVDAFNEEVRGVNANIWVHFCFGAPILYSPETPPLTYHMADVFPQIAECRADCIQSEAANTDGKYLEQELRAWKEYLSEKDYAVGAVTPYDMLETREDVDKITQIALKYVPPEKLALTSDEGLAGNGFLSRDGAIIKMKMLSEAARNARKNL